MNQRTIFFYYKCDRLYLAYFVHQIKKHISCRFIYAHVPWCQRKNIFKSSCNVWWQVFNGKVTQRIIYGICALTMIFIDKKKRSFVQIQVYVKTMNTMKNVNILKMQAILFN